MTAKEMFETLGYKQREKKTFIEYSKGDGFETTYIIFYKNGSLWQGYVGSYRIDNKRNRKLTLLDPKEIEAMQKQCKELGWLTKRRKITNDRRINKA